MKKKKWRETKTTAVKKKTKQKRVEKKSNDSRMKRHEKNADEGDNEMTKWHNIAANHIHLKNNWAV